MELILLCYLIDFSKKLLQGCQAYITLSLFFHLLPVITLSQSYSEVGIVSENRERC